MAKRIRSVICLFFVQCVVLFGLQTEMAKGEGVDILAGEAWVDVTDPQGCPGQTTEVPVMLDFWGNDVGGFSFIFTLSRDDILNFHTVSVDSVWVDDHWEFTRYCGIDTVGSLLSSVPNWEVLEARGEVGDPYSSSCKYLYVVGLFDDGGGDGTPLPDPGSGILFKVMMDVMTISDTVSDRTTLVYVTGDKFTDPGGASFDSTHFDDGSVTALYTYQCCKRGDANKDGQWDFVDILWLIDFVFRGGPHTPEPCFPIGSDANCDSAVDFLDILYMIDFVFRGGADPGCY